MPSGKSFSCFQGKVVLVTGHTGFKGSWLSLWLIELGANVVGFSRDIPTNPSLFVDINLQDKLFADIRGDVSDFLSLSDVINQYKPSFVFHLAAQALVPHSFVDPLLTFQSNTLGTITILEALRNITHNCVSILITSDKVYENNEWCWGYRETDSLGGKDPYSASKACAELAFSSYYHSFFRKTPTNLIATVRAGNVIGGGDWSERRIVPDIVRSYDSNIPLELRAPLATRPWQHVLEPLSGYLLLASQLFSGNTSSGQSFNFGPSSDSVHTVQDLVNEFNTHFSIPPTVFSQDPSVVDASLLKLSCDKALSVLGWSSTLDFPLTVQYTAEWYLRRSTLIGHAGFTSELSAFTVEQIGDFCSRAPHFQE